MERGDAERANTGASSRAGPGDGAPDGDASAADLSAADLSAAASALAARYLDLWERSVALAARRWPDTPKDAGRA